MEIKIFQGHGDHWLSLHPDPVELLSQAVSKCVNGKMITRWCDGFSSTLPMVWPEAGDVRFMAHIVVDNNHRSSVATCFPLLEGVATPCVIKDVLPWSEHQREGDLVTIMAQTQQQFSFFDPAFFKYHPMYTIGTVKPFGLAGLASTMAPVSASIEPVGLLPHPEGWASEYIYTVDVLDVADVSVPGKGVLELSVTKLLVRTHAERSPVEDPLLWLYVSRTVAGEYTPRPGDRITGQLWLQGAVVE